MDHLHSTEWRTAQDSEGRLYFYNQDDLSVWTLPMYVFIFYGQIPQKFSYFQLKNIIKKKIFLLQKYSDTFTSAYVLTYFFRLEDVHKSGTCIYLLEDYNNQYQESLDSEQIATNKSTNTNLSLSEWNPAYAVFHHKHYLSFYQNRSFLKFDGCKEKQKLDKNILFCQNLLTSPPVIKEKDSNSEVVVFCFRSDFGTVFKIQWDNEDLNTWQHHLNQISVGSARYIHTYL